MRNLLLSGFSSYLSRLRAGALHYYATGENYNEKKITCLPYIILLVFVLTNLIPAQNINALDNANLQWKAIGPPGGRVYSLTINPQETQIVFATSEGGLFKSTNGGVNSELVDSTFPFPEVPSISPLNPDLMFIAFYRTTDGGITWNRMETAGWSYAFHPIDENIVYAVNGDNYGVSGQNIIVSYNKGLSWDTLKIFTELITGLKSTSLNENFLFISTSTKLYKSTNAGIDWGEILTAMDGDIFGLFDVTNNDSKIYLITSLASRLGNPIKFYKSTDFGDNWEVDSLQSFLQASPANVMKIDPTNPNTIYLATGDYLYGYVGDILKSTDGGSSWKKTNNGLPSPYNRYLYSLVINPLDPQNLYVGTYGWGVYKTTNGGESWEWTNLTKGPVFSIHIDENNSDIIYACTIDEGVLKTTNGGLEWLPLNLDIPQTVQRPFFKIIFDPNNNEIAYIASQYGIFKTIDGGNSWRLTSLLGDFDHYVYEVSVHPKNSDILYTGLIGWLDRKDLYRSVDGGNTWTNLRLTKGEEGIAHVLFNPVNPDIIYIAAFSKGIYKSTDKGITWKQVNNGLQLTDSPLYELVESISIDELNPSILYSDNGGVIKTTNGGENWFRIDSSLFELEANIRISKVSYTKGIVYVSSNRGLYASSNEGLSWHKLGTFKIGLLGTGEFKINPAKTNKIFISTMTGIYKGGDSLTSVERDKDIPKSIHVYQNYPNPFNSSTKISFQLKKEGFIIIKIYNVLGKEVTTLIRNNFNPGYYEALWDGTNYSGKNLPSGIYYYTFDTKGYFEAKKMIILR